METFDYLKEQKPAILSLWYKETIETYPKDSVRLLLKSGDPFANPIGSIVNKSLNTIYNAVFEKVSFEELNKSLEELIRLRAVQDFTPSEALSFIFGLKKIILKELEKVGKADLAAINQILSEIDTIALLGFNLYVEAKEKLFEIRANSSRKQFSMMVEKLSNKYNLLDGSLT